MEKADTLSIQLLLQPEDIKPNVDTNKFLSILISERYNNTIYEGKVITHVDKVTLKDNVKVMPNGTLKFNIEVKCTVINPSIGDVIKVVVTGVNKMGALYKHIQLTIFIPKHLCINEEIPAVGDTVDLKIVGKRVEDKIVCIGSILT